MATIKKGILTRAPEWWVHLRPFAKRQFWGRERRAAQRNIKCQMYEYDDHWDWDFNRDDWDEREAERLSP